MFKVEVKTTDKPPVKSKNFSEQKTYYWSMDKRHELIIDDNLIYCFVHLEEIGSPPNIFIVPSRDVAEYLKWEHDHYLEVVYKRVNPSDFRLFRIEIDDPNNYCNN